MDFETSGDHWAFLEEMEAPMWVDLTLEGAHCNTQKDVDDGWFQSSNLFHQLSSEELKAAFSRSWEEKKRLDREGLGQSSPKLPTSVSRSRGKDYTSGKWRRGNCDVSLHKEQNNGIGGKNVLVYRKKKIEPRKTSLNPKSLVVDLGSCEEMKSKGSFVGQKGTSGMTLITQRSSTVKWNSLRHATVGASQCDSSSMIDKASESSTTSTVTSESDLQPQHNFFAVSNRALNNNSSGLLSELRITLRKSCITRQASRVETNKSKKQSTVETSIDRGQSTTMQSNIDRRESRNRKSSTTNSSVGSTTQCDTDRRESKNRKSSSSKSSVESSSGFVWMKKKDLTPDSRNARRIYNTGSGMKVVIKSNVSKVSTVRVKDGTYKRGDIPLIAKSQDKKIANSKVLGQTLDAKSLVPLKAKDQNSTSTRVAKEAQEKVRDGRLGELVGGGLENRMGKTSVRPVLRGRENGSTCAVGDQNGTKHNVSQKANGRRLAGSKGKIRDGTSSMHVNQSQRVLVR